VAEVADRDAALVDLERLEEVAPGAWSIIRTAITMLSDHPLVGRIVDDESGARELAISRGKTGYVALYEYDQVREQVLIVHVRHQRESGFSEGLDQAA